MTLHTTYFGSVDWYAALLCADEPVTIDTAEHYIKQTTCNHCLIATAGGVQKLTVPVTVPSATAGHGKPLTRDVRISDHGNWRHLHWQALSSAYGQSPFFDYLLTTSVLSLNNGGSSSLTTTKPSQRK